MLKEQRNIIIMGAAGRDFHNFNVFFRDNPVYQIIAFTATQIPNIEGRRYPPSLSGHLYPRGIPIYSENKLTDLLKRYDIKEVFFSYSDVSHAYVMDKASEVLAAGASFGLLGPNETMLKSKKSVIAVTAVRTGCGKSQVSQKIVDYYTRKNKKVVAVRHPMPYGNLAEQVVQRFATMSDLKKHKCTIEEREEYENYVEKGMVVYAGVDYEKILRLAEKEAEIIVWDGGNNDLPFYKSDLHIVVADPHRPDHEISYYPGEVNFRMADIIIVNKINTAKKENIKIVLDNARRFNPKAKIIKSDSVVNVANPKLIQGKKVLVVEDGPTVTHGGMSYGAGIVAAREFGAKEIIDPRPYAVGSIKKVYAKYTHLNTILPAMGYSSEQIRELEKTINSTPCDAVVIGTPINLGGFLKINKPWVRVRYSLKEIGKPTLGDILDQARF